MFLALFLSSILYRAKLKFKPEYVLTLPKYFHFQSGGEYTISVNTNVPPKETDSIYDYYICTEKQFINYLSHKNKEVCFYQSEIIVPRGNTTGEKSDKIDKTDSYQFLFYPSNYTSEKGEIEVFFKNPHSLLDANYLPCLYSEPVFAGIVAIMLILWSINWLMNSSCFRRHEPFAFKISSITLHGFITITYILTLLYIIFHFAELWNLHLYDKTTPLTPLTITFRFFSYWLLFSTLLLASKGWCIVRPSLSNCQIFQCTCCAFFLVLPITLTQYVYLDNYWVIAFLFAMLISMLVFYRMMTQSISNARCYVIAHLIVIADDGIDPLSTPVYQKYRMFKGLSYSCMLYFLLSFFTSSIVEILSFPFYIDSIFQEILTISFLAIAGFLFRLRHELRNGYMMIGDVDNDKEQKTFNKIDILEIPVHSIGSNSEEPLKTWDPGMLLPPQPIILNDTDDVQRSNDNENGNNQNGDEVKSIEEYDI